VKRQEFMAPYCFAEEGVMDQRTLVILIVAVAALCLIVWAYLREQRSRSLRRQFGPEYDHVTHERGRSRAERELVHRVERVERLAIKPLSLEQRQRYSERWKQEQARFVDEPKVAVDDADQLVQDVMRERGYPVGEFDQRVADISVDHPRVVENYRAAHSIAQRERRGEASTEDLRQAMIHYRDLFIDLLEESLPKGAPGR
jgi:hypothetical protein